MNRWPHFLFLMMVFLDSVHAKDFLSQDISELIRNKMVEVSLAQSQKMSGHWDISQRDCAGFIRFVYKKAVGSSGAMWINQKGEAVSYLGAQELFSFNFDYLGHDLSSDQLKTGDILVYNLPSGKEQIWHLILILSAPRGAPQRLLAMYHNGENGKKARLKKAWASDFLSEIHGPWSARPSNGNFLGIFRWKGWKSIDTKKNWKWFEETKVGLK